MPMNTDSRTRRFNAGRRAASSASAATTGTSRFSPGGPAHLVGSGSPRLTGAIRHQAKSANWSGYAATTGTYTSATASWTQPSASCGRGDQYSAFWVGIDGYSSATVEQTGSEADCAGRTAVYNAWYEMYPGPSENYPNTVRPGDHFTATVTYEGSNEFSLSIADTTEGWSQATTASLAGAARSSAEVIVEAPCCTSSGGILPLADFGTVNFTRSLADGSALGNAGGLTEIVMVDNSGRQKDSVSALRDGENFSATWRRRS